MKATTMVKKIEYVERRVGPWIEIGHQLIDEATTMTDDEGCLERADRLIREGVAGDRGLIASMIYEAVTSEREACARLMTSYARKDRDEKRVTAFADAADAIRARSTTTV